MFLFYIGPWRFANYRISVPGTKLLPGLEPFGKTNSPEEVLAQKGTLQYLDHSQWDPMFAAIPEETGQFTAQKCPDISFDHIAPSGRKYSNAKTLNALIYRETNTCRLCVAS